jgi:hypothetical protein
MTGQFALRGGHFLTLPDCGCSLQRTKKPGLPLDKHFLAFFFLPGKRNEHGCSEESSGIES